MSKYKLSDNGVFDKENNMYIPNAPGNRHWREYQEWLSQGNVPEQQYDLQNLKTIKTNEINHKRKKFIDSGIECLGYTWDSDDISRNNLIGTLLAYNAGILKVDETTGYVIKWRTKDNQDVFLTPQDLTELSTTMLNHVNNAYLISWDSKNQITNCKTKDEIDVIEINSLYNMLKEKNNGLVE